MNITFMVGNGFDRNLGLKTAYSDFVKAYKSIETNNYTLRNFRNYINNNEELWSAAEVEMGRYTARFKEGEGAIFYQCHKDFCENLADYLKEESRKIDYKKIDQTISTAFARINLLTEPFPTQEKAAIDAIYERYTAENTIFNFIVYNYTDTLDKCIANVRNRKEVLGEHRYGARLQDHTVGVVCHVHGTVDTQMVFGVNDKAQIANPGIFNCEYGDLYEDLLIKRQANQGYQENTDDKAKKLVDNSQIIYIYGMSIGITDALWWERICEWLIRDSSHHLIVHRYGMPPRGLLEVDYKIQERIAKQEITSYSPKPDNLKREIEKRIHITGENIFADLHNIATKIELGVQEMSGLHKSVGDTPMITVV